MLLSISLHLDYILVRSTNKLKFTLRTMLTVISLAGFNVKFINIKGSPVQNFKYSESKRSGQF